ncbi:U-box domain-containing protein 24-like [Malania oleifera]|uniref:U-box domain-containing protein 24-like n=1 Tax=Malania oleifera TaxID=397392 RepID=UPI0025AE6FCC|nr:U-box domain-containing protein 24-like [Malania oleifera]XP_057976623.1 U-box domain-containing protein 24-like [Malania oleifera]XP_057976624.1 U-box domain-containing protein 24-like [Malania oleifera]
MQVMNSRSFPELVSELLVLAEEVTSLAKDSEIEREIFAEFALFIAKFTPILIDLSHNDKVMDTPTIRKAAESLKEELGHAKSLIETPSPKQIQDVTRELGQSLGHVLLASPEVTIDIKEKIGALHSEMLNARFNACPSCESELVDELQLQGEITEDDHICHDPEEVVLQLKYGKDEEFKFALLSLNDFVRCKTISDEWINNEGIVPILFNRLGSSKQKDRSVIIQILRILVVENADYKEKMAEAASLSTLVKSLSRDVEERREAVGLLLALSDLPAVHRRIGRIQGCIVMLVTMLNGDDPIASHDARKLLNALSSNAQNTLHMAEAGYFKPLVQYLKEGSDMSKILMATALSRMELTNQRRAALGEDGAIEPLVKMFNGGKLEAKLSALSALRNLSILKENIHHLISAGIVVPLLQLLFSVTSVFMTLREPASAILARIAQSEAILVNQDVAQQMLSLLNLSSPIIQHHLLEALNSIAAHSSSSNVKNKMIENGAIRLLLPFLTEPNIKIRSGALDLLYTLSKDMPGDLTDQLGETLLNIIVNIISSSTSKNEIAAAIGLLSNLPVNDKKATDALKKANLLPILVSILSSSTATSTPSTSWLEESTAGLLIRFTIPSDKKLQQFSAESGIIPLLVKFLITGSMVAKCRAATSLAQLSQNSLSLRKSRASRWLCVPPSADAFCAVHDGYCSVKSTFCLVKAGAISPLIQILEGKERDADAAVLGTLATLLQDEIWENGSNLIATMCGIQSIIKILEIGNINAQEKALWILERIFRVEDYRTQFGGSAQVLLIDLAQNGEPRLKSTIAKLLAQLELLQLQSSYF